MPYSRANSRFLLFGSFFLSNGMLAAAVILSTIALHAWTRIQSPRPIWTELVQQTAGYGVLAGQLFVLSLIGALVDRNRLSVWLAAAPLAALLGCGFVAMDIGDQLYAVLSQRTVYQARLLGLMLAVGSILPIIICYASLLMMNIGLWPLKVVAGWRIARIDENDCALRHAPIAHLMLWIGLWGALLLLAVRSFERFGADGFVAVAIGGGLLLVTGFPVACLLSCRWKLRWRCTAVMAYVIALTVFESGFTYYVLRPPGFINIWRLFVVITPFNFSLAAAIAINCWVLSGLGMRMSMPLWFRRPASTGVDPQCPVGHSVAANAEFRANA